MSSKEYQRTYYRKNRKKIVARQKQWFEENREWYLAYMKKYNKEHYTPHPRVLVAKGTEKERRHQYDKRQRDKNRKLVIDHYGNKCMCCGESEYMFLTIDHIEGNGNEHRRQIRTSVYGWLVRNDYPAGFQILCYNCNMSKGFYGSCPHLTKGKKESIIEE